ncbi:MAG: universal stress protein, partial [Albidovulum sp.]
AHFTLIHVVETVPVYAVGYIPVVAIETNRDEIKTELEGLAATLPNASVFIADGKPGARILRWADENGCDCIIIASHEPVMSDYLIGSTAHQVVRHAKCAVHVVR